MQHDTLSEELCTTVLAEPGYEASDDDDAEDDARPTLLPPSRRFDANEIGGIMSHFVLASTARCPIDDSFLVTSVQPHLIALRCPQCGASAEWRAAS